MGRRGELDEFLVVRIAAFWQALHRDDLDAAREPPRLIQSGALRLAGDAVLAEVVGEHALKLSIAGGIDHDLRAPEMHGVAQAAHAGIVEDQPVEPDLSIEDQFQAAMKKAGRARLFGLQVTTA